MDRFTRRGFMRFWVSLNPECEGYRSQCLELEFNSRTLFMEPTNTRLECWSKGKLRKTVDTVSPALPSKPWSFQKHNGISVPLACWEKKSEEELGSSHGFMTMMIFHFTTMKFQPQDGREQKAAPPGIRDLFCKHFLRSLPKFKY